MPQSIVSDRDPTFTSFFLKGIFSFAGHQFESKLNIPPPIRRSVWGGKPLPWELFALFCGYQVKGMGQMAFVSWMVVQHLFSLGHRNVSLWSSLWSAAATTTAVICSRNNQVQAVEDPLRSRDQILKFLKENHRSQFYLPCHWESKKKNLISQEVGLPRRRKPIFAKTPR